MFIVTAPYVGHSNRQEIIRENDFTDDTLLVPICFSDNCFVTKSGMTTDEAIVIKNGMLRRINEKYGDYFTTTSVTLIKDTTIIKQERQNMLSREDAIYNAQFVLGAAFILFILIAIMTKGTQR